MKELAAMARKNAYTHAVTEFVGKRNVSNRGKRVTTRMSKQFGGKFGKIILRIWENGTPGIDQRRFNSGL